MRELGLDLGLRIRGAGMGLTALDWTGLDVTGRGRGLVWGSERGFDFTVTITTTATVKLLIELGR